MSRAHIYALIDAERDRQGLKWAGEHVWGSGDCSSPRVEPVAKVAVLTEEIGEVARAVLDQDGDNLRDELVQVAAVAVAWLELIEARITGLDPDAQAADVPQPGADRTCTECGEPVDRDGLTTGECGGGGGQKCDECFACSCDGSC